MTVENLEVTFGTVTAVRNVSFHVDEGEIVVIAGPNGAGKTTTTETLLGFRRPTAGAVSLFGLDPVTDHRRTTALVGALLIPVAMVAAMALKETFCSSLDWTERADGSRDDAPGGAAPDRA